MAADFGKQLDFIRGCEIFKSVSLFTLLPITNNLISRKYKLGELILLAGEVPQGLYIVKKGYCKVGIDITKPVEIDNERYAKRRTSSQQEVNFAHGPDHVDPMRRDRLEKRQD